MRAKRREGTLTRSFLGCFLSSLLHDRMADLFEPVSSASGRKKEGPSVRCVVGERGITDHRWGEFDGRVQTTSQRDTSKTLRNNGRDGGGLATGAARRVVEILASVECRHRTEVLTDTTSWRWSRFRARAKLPCHSDGDDPHVRRSPGTSVGARPHPPFVNL